jgi:hypothetical protein
LFNGSFWLVAACQPAESSAVDRYQVLLHVTAETSDNHVSCLNNGHDVTAETSRRLCSDASINRLVGDETGEPLSIGRKSRVIPPAMRRALKARDRQCRFQGCTHRCFIHGHRVQHWADGGETSLDNLIQLCRHHHRLVHEGDFRCEKDPTGKVVFRNAFGNVIPETGYRPPQNRQNVIIDLKKKLEDRFIHSRTCVTRWEGELMDRHLAVGLLYDLDTL